MRIYTLFIFMVLLVGCATTHELNSENEHNNKTLKLLDRLPTQIDEFEYQSYHDYEEPALGYSLRYFIKGLGYADIYIYPVPEEGRRYSHQNIVIGMAHAAIRDIQYYGETGVYSNVKLLSSQASAHEKKITSKAELVVTKDNLEYYTLIYLTERSNKLIKARVTVNNNEENRLTKKWDDFINRIFALIIENIEIA